MEIGVTVGAVAQRELLTCPPSTLVSEAAALMRQAGCSSILIEQEGKILGIWTEADALRLDFESQELGQLPIEKMMSSPVTSLPASKPLVEVAEFLRSRNIRHALVEFNSSDDDCDIQKERYGMVTQTDLTLNMEIESFLCLRQVNSVEMGRLQLPLSLSLPQVVEQMRATSADAALVMDNDQVVGIVTQADLVAVLAKGGTLPLLSEVACKELITIHEDESLLHARQLLQRRGIRHLVVTGDENQECSLLSMRNILYFLQLEYTAQLRDALEQRDNALKQSQYSLHLAEKVIESSLDGIVITDADSLIIKVNPAFTQLTGFTAEEALGQPMSLMSSGRHEKEFYSDMWRSLQAKGYWRGEIWNKRKNGEVFPELLSITAICDEQGNPQNYTALFNDITHLKRNEERIRNLAYFDELTGLPNRRLFNDRLNMAISNGRRHNHRVALMFIDIDLFKRINDTLGHSGGDQVLKTLGKRLNQAIREEDTLARLGGDEFVILMPEIESDEAITTVGQRVTEKVRHAITVDEEQLFVTASIGTCIFPDDGKNAEQLLKNADTAMYQVKARGRNGLQRFQAVMQEQSQRSLSLEAQLRNAITRDELSIHYQPQICLQHRQMVGLEALLRWNNEVLGQVSPAEFIPVAEAQGLISELGRWVIKSACQQGQHWRNKGYGDIPIAVNVSPLQLQQECIGKAVTDALAATGFPPHLLELEITESAFINDSQSATRQLEELKAHGITVALDDFGTGYSSLNCLHTIPLDRIKIDASFVQRLSERQIDDQVVNAIIAMAHSMNLRVVAEGVETEEQLNSLARLNCDQVQGYFTGRPQNAKEVKELLEGISMQVSH